MRKLFLILACCALWLPGAASAAECPTELKPTDTYKELSAALKCLNERMKALESQKASKAVAAEAQAAGVPKAVALKPTASGSAGHYQVDLLKCQRTGAAIKCSMTITSLGKDGRLYIHPAESKLFDTQGRDFGGTTTDLGGVSSSRSSLVSKDLIADVPTAANASFAVDEAVAGISSLRTHVCGDNIGCQTLSFRNISIN